MEGKIKSPILDIFSLRPMHHTRGNVREANWSSGERLGYCYKFASHQHTAVFEATGLDEEMKIYKVRIPSKH